MHYKDLVGIGLGPSNLSLAIALLEKEMSKECLFLDKGPQNTIWHSGMMLDKSMLQISFLKDLVTMYNPRSHFSFVNYLQENGRLNQFINLKTMFPTRWEYSDYLNWVKRELPKEILNFEKKVIDVSPLKNSKDEIDQLAISYISSDTDDIQTIITKNLVVSVGGKPFVPEMFKELNQQIVFHSSRFKQSIEKFNKDSKLRVGVIGAGQSAAEIVEYLHNNYLNSTIYPIFKGSSYKPADSTSFVNEVFFPEKVDEFYYLETSAKQNLLTELYDTNYSRMTQTIITNIYNKMYDDKLMGKERIKFYPSTIIEEAVEYTGGLHLTLANKFTKIKEILNLDVIVLATGYNRKDIPEFLNSIEKYFLYSNGQLKISRDYKIKTTESFKANIFIQGQSEHTHGISDSLLSVLPIRAQEILTAYIAGKDNKKIKKVEV